MTQAGAITVTATPRTSDHTIARGASGRLFYEHYAGYATHITDITKEPLFPPPLAVRWRRTLETRARLLKLRGLRFFILIAPEPPPSR